MRSAFIMNTGSRKDADRNHTRHDQNRAKAPQRCWRMGGMDFQMIGVSAVLKALQEAYSVLRDWQVPFTGPLLGVTAEAAASVYSVSTTETMILKCFVPTLVKVRGHSQGKECAGSQRSLAF